MTYSENYEYKNDIEFHLRKSLIFMRLYLLKGGENKTIFKLL